MSYGGIGDQLTELHWDYPESETHTPTPHVALDLRSTGGSTAGWSRNNGDVTPTDLEGGKLNVAKEVTDDGDLRLGMN